MFHIRSYMPFVLADKSTTSPHAVLLHIKMQEIWQLVDLPQFEHDYGSKIRRAEDTNTAVWRVQYGR